MPLISTANLLAILDHYGAAYQKVLAAFDSVVNVASPTLGTVQDFANRAKGVVAGSNDDDVQFDVIDGARTSFGKANAEQGTFFSLNMLDALYQHLNRVGNTVSTTIIDINTFLTYYNGAGGGIFQNMVTPQFALLYTAQKAANLSVGNVMSPEIHPLFAGVSANGMGKRAVGGSFVAGTAVNTTLYSAVVPVIENTIDFSGGSAPPTVTIAGTDHTGVTSTTWSATLTGNNPTAALSATITPAVTAAARQTVVVSSLTGIVAGSVLTVNTGLPDQETIIVESINGGATTLTAVFMNAHAGGATLTGFNSYATTPSVSGRRCVSVSGITIGITGHAAGTVRVTGRQDRVAI